MLTSSLDGINKARKQQSELCEILHACDRRGILTKGYIIIGYPWEDRDSLEETRRSIVTLPVDEIRVSFFTPFPGSPAYETFKDRLNTRDWSKFNAIRDIVVSNVNGLSDDELREARSDIFRQFYNSPEYVARTSRKVDSFPDLTEAFDEFEGFLRKGGVMCDANRPKKPSMVRVQ